MAVSAFCLGNSDIAHKVKSSKDKMCPSEFEIFFYTSTFTAFETTPKYLIILPTFDRLKTIC